MAPSNYIGVVGEYSKPVPHFSVHNFRSEKKIKNARLSDKRGAFPDCDTDDEFEMVGHAKKHGDKQPSSRTFYNNVRDYMISYVTRSKHVLTHLRDHMHLYSVPVKGERTYYRGKKINPKTLNAMLKQPMKDPANMAFTYGLIHGFKKEDNPSPEHPGIPFRYQGVDYTHHGISSISSMYWTGKRYGLKTSEPAGVRAEGDIPLLLELETTKDNPFRAIIPKYNYYPRKFLHDNPSSEHEMFLDLKNNTYCLSRVIYDSKLKMWVAKIWASNGPVQFATPKLTPQPTVPKGPATHAKEMKKGPITINPKVTKDADKLAAWNKIYNLLEDCPDYSLTMSSRGEVRVDATPPHHSYLKTHDSDNNALADAAADSDKHIRRYSHRPFVVITDLKHSENKPHLLIVPTPVRKGNYQDLRQFLKHAPDHQKIALWDTMAKLINNTKQMPETATLFKTNGGHLQAFPFFSIHYMPYIKD